MDQEAVKKVPWSIKEALAIFLIFIILTIFGGDIRLLIEYVLGLFSIELTIFGFFIVFSFLQFVIFIFYIYQIVTGKYKESLGIFFEKKYSFFDIIKYGILSSLTLFVATMAAGIFIFYLFPSDGDPQAILELLNYATTKKEMALVFIVTVFFAPISEELYFRGFLYKAFRNKFPMALSIAFASIIFGAVHFDLYRFVPFFIAGVVLNHIYEKYQNIVIPMIAHGIWNGIMVLALFTTMGS